ncbi:glutathione S-transferase family protein [Roseovarius sp.]|uniref:glutathione S-transferase family protein n=1 Tax=Roseovarius sp. TaxID=1486281 RepID=UPI003BAC5467
MLTVWGRKTSSNVQAVMWGIAELGLDCTRHDVGHRYGGTDTDDFIAMNPNRTVPVLQDGDDAPLWESAAILRYLANRYGSDPFWPEDASARAQVDKWAEWAKINVGGAFTVPIFWRVVRTPEAKRDWPAIRAAVAALEGKLAIAEARLGQVPYLAGEDFTLADVQFGHVLYRYYEIGIERAELPNVARYYERLQAREAYRAHVMVSYAELAVS